MKLIKKIAAIMFAFMMVFSLSTNVKAKTGSQTASPKGGSIIINKTIKDQDYKIYKIFELESFNTEPAPDGVYSYKITDDWREFFTTGDGQTYVTEENGYVKSNITDSNVADFTKKALAYTKNITATKTVKGTGGEVSVNDLEFGYYLVDSTAGAFCGLTTTNPNVTIDEKNEKPKVDKYISLAANNKVKKNNVSIGDTFMYETEVNVGKGAKNFVLYDKLPEGLTLNRNFNGPGTPIHLQAQVGEPDPIVGQDYSVDLDAADGSYTFKITFTDEYLNNLHFNKTISVVYEVTVNESAPINQPMTNKTWLTYGDNSTKANESQTDTYTFGIPVFKYTQKVLNQRQGLKGVTFSLYTDKDCSDAKVLTFKENGNNYLYSKDATATKVLASSGDGTFNINGLKAGTYYLKEIATLDGYNKLENPIKVVVAQGENGKSVITTDKNTQSVERVEVLNNSGSILPSTGGMGTTLIYLIGGALVLGSGFVLANKKRAKAK